MAETFMDGIVRPQDLPSVVGFTVHTARRTPDFPSPIQLSKRSIGFKRSELQAWLENRPRGYMPTDSTPHEAGRLANMKKARVRRSTGV